MQNEYLPLHVLCYRSHKYTLSSKFIERVTGIVMSPAMNKSVRVAGRTFLAARFVHHMLHVSNLELSMAIDFTRAIIVVTTQVTSVEAGAETIPPYISE